MEWRISSNQPTPVAMSKQREIAFRHFMLNYFPNRDEIWALLCFLLSISIFMSCISRISNEFIWMASISPIVVSNNAFLSHHFFSSFSSSSFSRFYRNNVLISWRKIKLWTDTTWASYFFSSPCVEFSSENFNNYNLGAEARTVA